MKMEDYWWHGQASQSQDQPTIDNPTATTGSPGPKLESDFIPLNPEPAMDSPSPGQPAQPHHPKSAKHCKYFSTSGSCGKKHRCRFIHDVEVRNQAIQDKDRGIEDEREPRFNDEVHPQLPPLQYDDLPIPPQAPLRESYPISIEDTPRTLPSESKARKTKLDTGMKRTFREIRQLITKEEDPKKQQNMAERTLRAWEADIKLTRPFILQFGVFLRQTVPSDVWEEILEGHPALKEKGNEGMGESAGSRQGMGEVSEDASNLAQSRPPKHKSIKTEPNRQPENTPDQHPNNPLKRQRTSASPDQKYPPSTYPAFTPGSRFWSG